MLLKWAGIFFLLDEGWDGDRRGRQTAPCLGDA